MSETKNATHKHHHWHHVYKKRRRRALGISPKEIAGGQLLSLVGAVLAGLHLDNNKGELALIVGAFVILPGVFDLDGSIGGALSAKINHRLEDPHAKTLHVLARSLGFALLIALLASMVVGIIGGAIAALFFHADFYSLFKLAVGAILLGAIIGFPIVASVTIILRRLGVNPDDVMGPLETSFFDILAVITLVLVAGWLI